MFLSHTWVLSGLSGEILLHESSWVFNSYLTKCRWGLSCLDLRYYLCLKIHLHIVWDLSFEGDKVILLLRTIPVLPHPRSVGLVSIFVYSYIWQLQLSLTESLWNASGKHWKWGQQCGECSALWCYGLCLEGAGFVSLCLSLRILLWSRFWVQWGHKRQFSGRQFICVCSKFNPIIYSSWSEV